MKSPPARALPSLLVLGWLIATATTAAAQSGGPYNLSWSALSAGGSSSGGSFGVKGLVSPPNAGHAAGGPFTIDGGWGGVLSTIGVQDPPELPSAFALLAPVPNPFTHSSTVSFELPRSGPVRVAVYDLGGRCVKVLVDRSLAPGRHRVEWMGDDDAGAHQAGGVYFVRMESGDFHQSSRIVLLH